MEKTVCNEFISQLEQKIREESPSQEAEQLIPFSQKVFELFPIEELAQEPMSDISAFVRSLWAFFQKMDPGKPKIRIFNPVLKEDNWDSSRTNIFILQRDMSFLVDSIAIELNRQGLGIQAVKSTVLNVSRDGKGKLKSFLTEEAQDREALIFFQTDRFSSVDTRDELHDELSSVLAIVEAVTDDYQSMLSTMDGIIEEAQQNNPNFDEQKQQEFLTFLEWLRGGNFTFLGYTSFELGSSSGEEVLSNNVEVEQGLLRLYKSETSSVPLASLNEGMRDFYRWDSPLAFSKSAWRAKVHRQAYSDYIHIKRYNSQGDVIGEHRFIGLYTSQVFSLSPFKIPIIRKRVSKIFDRSGLDPSSHDGKALKQIIEVHPREELFHSSDEQLFSILIGIWQIQERRQVRLFVRSDSFGKFISCIVYMPRDIYRTEIRSEVQSYLCQEMDASESEFYTYFAESVLARTHYILKICSDRYKSVNHKELERHITMLTHDWRDDLQEACIEQWGEEQGRSTALNYRNAFSASYQDHFDPHTAVQDIELITELPDESRIAMNFYKPPDADKNIMRFKIFHLEQRLGLSDLVPILENLGFQVLGEHPYEIISVNGPTVWLHEFTLSFGLDIAVDIVAIRNNFHEAFAAIWSGIAENDHFNRLIVGARLEWREVALLRLYAEYMKQLGQSFSRSFIAHTLVTNLDITRNLVALFKSYFDANYLHNDCSKRSDQLYDKTLMALDNVANLNEDQVLRTYLHLMAATLRTNFFQRDREGNIKPYLAIKLSPADIPIAPEPRPKYEIFVHSPRVEGVHLRGGKVARGGIRWSDRVEDYRTEVLGLAKAQQVKNAVIVPMGAKGGFVAKQIDRVSTREAMLEEGIACYKMFIQGLLDVTDNLVAGEVEQPRDVICRDGDDPYLVVAADKGTATFSDIANDISEQYGHWLGDAYASGGSNGYDHKKMGITARGAWVAVQRHFRELGLNTQEEEFTAVGIGDMSGDVFGNGLLMSKTIKLVAAFNHLHIIIDPDPDSARSFEERKRLFELPRSSWLDYNQELISEGGGIFSRTAKSIELTPQIKALFDISEGKLRPNQLIQYILKSRVDLIWNGGIGTYVKATAETNMEVGDRVNDSLRIDGKELRCRVFGEGGNLGLTQRGRVEYCLNGGACNTDFIDNAGGVDCSDREVNIKIALNQLVANGDLTGEQRNLLLEDMTDSVADGVLHNSYRQTQVISLAKYKCSQNLYEYWRCITDWESAGRLNRQLEFLPDDETLSERAQAGQDLTRPELSVLVSYSKILLKEDLAQSDIFDDTYITQAMFDAFPAKIIKQYPDCITNHSLRNEIIINQIANEIVNLMGLSFFQRQIKSTGAEVGDVACAYLIMRDTLQLKSAWKAIEALDYRQPSATQFQLFDRLMRLGRRVSRWILRNRRICHNIQEEIATLAPIIQSIIDSFPDTLETEKREVFDMELARLEEMGLSNRVAMLINCSDNLCFSFGIADVHLKTGLPTKLVSQAYFQLGKILQLDWFAAQIVLLPHASRWEDIARESFIDELESQRRQLTILLLENVTELKHLPAAIQDWERQQTALIARWTQVINELKAAPSIDFAMFHVAQRELLDLVQVTRHQRDNP